MAAEHNPDGAALAPGTIVGIAGAGTMGTGIAQVAVLAGHPVRLYDSYPGAATAAVERVRSAIDHLAHKQKITPQQALDASALLGAVDSLSVFTGCGLIVEAIVEDLQTKRRLLRELEPFVDRDALLATNTSSLSVTAIAAALDHPERFAGMHFFNPAPVMPLVEIVSGAATSPRTADVLCVTAQHWGKAPVRAWSTPGFIVNRVARPFYGEALRMLEERAADCATIDAVVRECGGFRMGPFELMDLIGNDVNYVVTRSIFDAFYGDPRYTPSNFQFELVQAGNLGRKTSRGFYRYESGRPIAAPSTATLRSAPAGIHVYGDSPLSQAIAERMTAAGTWIERDCAHADDRVAVCGDCVLYQTDARTATARAAATGIRNTVLSDLALDYRTAARVAIAAADQCETAALDAAAGLLQLAGYAVSIVDDIPGMVVMRTVVMLANEAADAVNQGVCSVADLDLAMRLGLNFPRGPLEWADAIGVGNVLRALDRLNEAYGDGRYRASPLLRRKAFANATFTCLQDSRSTAQPAPDYEPTRG